MNPLFPQHFGLHSSLPSFAPSAVVIDRGPSVVHMVTLKVRSQGNVKYSETHMTRAEAEGLMCVLATLLGQPASKIKT